MKVADAGAPAAGFITASADGDEMHPEEFVTVKLCVPAESPVIVVVRVLPAIPPGLIVQFPAGRPESATLPVATAHVAWVIVPTTGAGGAPGGELRTTFPDKRDVHPASLVTVKLCVPADSPDMVVDRVLPAIPTGSIVQFPAGSPESTTLPVDDAQVGCVMVPTVGAAGVTGWVFIDAVTPVEMHVLSEVLLTRMVWFPGATLLKVREDW